MSSWFSDWQRIKGRLHAHERALRTAADSVRADGENLALLLTLARTESSEMLGELAAFLGSHGEALPEKARSGLAELVAHQPLLTDFSNAVRLTSASTVLAFKLASINYYLSDHEARWRSLVDRSFLHLDRLIVADGEVRRKWSKAFGKGEPACEQLGGAHLLHHGIWAFKAVGEGERTDLVLGTPMSEYDIELAERAAETMVLTEWKVVRGKDKVRDKHAEAVSQLKQYAGGVLAGFQMQSTRYAVTVGADRVTPLAPITDGPVSYRHVHVAVSPSSPSKLSRGAGRSARSR